MTLRACSLRLFAASPAELRKFNYPKVAWLTRHSWAQWRTMVQSTTAQARCTARRELVMSASVAVVAPVCAMINLMSILLFFQYYIHIGKRLLIPHESSFNWLSRRHCVKLPYLVPKRCFLVHTVWLFSRARQAGNIVMSMHTWPVFLSKHICPFSRTLYTTKTYHCLIKAHGKHSDLDRLGWRWKSRKAIIIACALYQ